MRLVLKLIRKNLLRRPGRTALTIGGVASAMFLFVAVEALSHGLDEALSGSEAARTLIVYRQNRYCPQTSFLPERYTSQIAKVPGVKSVLPVKVFLNNCRASLDLIAFQGAPVDEMLRQRPIQVIAGDADQFRREKDSALVGRAFAERRGLEPGKQFRFGNINVKVAGIFDSAEPVDEGLVLTHLEFLQRAGPVDRLGTVTQYDVKIDDASRAKEIGAAIDELFKTAEEPTDTRPQVQFLLDATRDLRELLRFGRIFGIVCVAVVLVLVANTVLMAVQERTREFGVYLTLGYRAPHLMAMVLGETLFLTAVGAAAGIGGALLAIRLSGIAIGVEGVSVAFSTSASVILNGLAVAFASGAAAGLLPAIKAARSDVVTSLRSA